MWGLILLAAIVVGAAISVVMKDRALVDRHRLSDLQRKLEDAESPDRLALYYTRDGDEFDLAAIYRREDREGFAVIGGRQSDGARLLEHHEELEPARAAAIAFAGSDKETDWVIQGTLLPDIEAAAEYAVNADPDGDPTWEWDDD